MFSRGAAFVSPFRLVSLGNRGRKENVQTYRCCSNRPTAAATAITWNINSMRALLRKNPKALTDLVETYNPDVLCLQETKLQEQHEKLFVNLLDEYGYETVMFNSSKTRLGYSGTVTYAKRRCYISQRSINHEVGDMEGRMVLLQFPGVYVINVYTMNSGTELRRLDMRMSWDSAFRKMIRQVREDGKPIMVLGDLNVAHEDYDVYDAKQAQGAPGFSHLERQSFRDTLESCGLVDAYRMLYPEERERYTFWEYKTRARARNAGWRIDYALVSEDMVGAVSNVRILDDVEGSDHCPVAIDIAAGML